MYILHSHFLRPDRKMSALSVYHPYIRSCKKIYLRYHQHSFQALLSSPYHQTHTYEYRELSHNIHNYKVEEILPTCTEKGYTTYSCLDCYYKYTGSVVDPLDHNVVVDSKVEPTCTESGLTEGSHCDRCNLVLEPQTTIEPLGHSYNSVVTSPTCLDKGYTTHTCKVCNDTYIDNYVDALGHNIIVDSKVAKNLPLTTMRQCEELIVDGFRYFGQSSMDSFNFCSVSEEVRECACV